jgi:cation diffusion facilitator family transporter
MASEKQNASKHIQFQKYIFWGGIVLFIIKVVAFYVSNSVGILSDTLESSINIITGFITLQSLRYAAKPRDEDHPYGHGKVELISASMEGILIGVAGILILIESFKRLHSPPAILTMDLGIALILFTAVANYMMGKWSVKRGQQQSSIALISGGQHLKSDAYSTLALILGLLAYQLLGYVWLDSLLAIIFGCFILYTGYKVLRSTINGLMDEADNVLLSDLTKILQKHRKPEWIGIHKLTSLKFGSVMHIDLHLSLPWFYNVYQANAEATLLKNILRQNFTSQELDISIQSEPCSYVMCHFCMMDCPYRKHAKEEIKSWTSEQITGKNIFHSPNV